MAPRSSTRAAQRVSYRESESDDDESMNDDSFSESEEDVEEEAPRAARPTRLKRKRFEEPEPSYKKPSTRGMRRIASYAEESSENEQSNVSSDEDGEDFEIASAAHKVRKQKASPIKKSTVSPRKRSKPAPRPVPPPARPTKGRLQACLKAFSTQRLLYSRTRSICAQGSHSTCLGSSCSRLEESPIFGAPRYYDACVASPLRREQCAIHLYFMAPQDLSCMPGLLRACARSPLPLPTTPRRGTSTSSAPYTSASPRQQVNQLQCENKEIGVGGSQFSCLLGRVRVWSF